MAVDLARDEVPPEGKAMPALRPSQAVTDGHRVAHQMALPRVANVSDPVAVYWISKRDLGEIGGPGIAQTKGLGQFVVEVTGSDPFQYQL